MYVLIHLRDEKVVTAVRHHQMRPLASQAAGILAEEGVFDGDIEKAHAHFAANDSYVDPVFDVAVYIEKTEPLL